MGLLSMRVSQGRVVSVLPQATVLEACQKMNENKVGSVVVLEGEKLLGIFTERDLLNRVGAKGFDIKKTCLREVMTTEVAAVSINDSIQDCFKKMEGARCRRLPIVEEGKVIGMVTMRDILEWLMKEIEEENEQMRRYIQS